MTVPSISRADLLNAPDWNQDGEIDQWERDRADNFFRSSDNNHDGLLQPYELRSDHSAMAEALVGSAVSPASTLSRGQRQALLTAALSIPASFTLDRIAEPLRFRKVTKGYLTTKEAAQLLKQRLLESDPARIPLWTLRKVLDLGPATLKRDPQLLAHFAASPRTLRAFDRQAIYECPEIRSIYERYWSTLTKLGISSMSVDRFKDATLNKLVEARLNVTGERSDRTVVFAYSSTDYNGAFDSTRVDDFLFKGYTVLYYELRSDADLATALRDAARPKAGTTTLRPVDAVVIAGHGSRNSTEVAAGTNEKDELDPGDEKQLRRARVRNYVKPGGSVLLFSCSTGEGGPTASNMATFFHRVFNGRVHVFAPNIPTFAQEVLFDAKHGVRGIAYASDNILVHVPAGARSR